jgi:hypothetical protein
MDKSRDKPFGKMNTRPCLLVTLPQNQSCNARTELVEMNARMCRLNNLMASGIVSDATLVLSWAIWIEFERHEVGPKDWAL